MLWFVLASLVALGVCLVLPRRSDAASLRICFVDPLPNLDVSTAPAFVSPLIGTPTPLSPDLLILSALVEATKRCAVVPVPATLVRGRDFTTTMTYVNTLGEVSEPSNGVTFYFPNRPTKPTILEVQVVTP